MTGKRIWKVLFALVIIAGLALGGVAVYQGRLYPRSDDQSHFA